MKVDYSQGKIYKITNDYNDDIYIGSTCDRLVKRFSKHKIDMNTDQKKHRKLYVLMNEIGFDRFRIELICNYPCEDKYQLRQKEGEYIRQMGTLNKRIEGRTKLQYYDENKVQIQTANKIYRIENKEKLMQYRQLNKDKLNEYNKQYRIENKEKLQLSDKRRLEKNRDKIKEYKSEKVTCTCGCSVRRDCLKEHQKTKKHQDLMDNLFQQSN